MVPILATSNGTYIGNQQWYLYSKSLIENIKLNQIIERKSKQYNYPEQKNGDPPASSVTVHGVKRNLKKI